MCKPYLDPEVCTSVTDCRRIPGHHVAEVVVAVLIQSDTEVHTTSTTVTMADSLLTFYCVQHRCPVSILLYYEANIVRRDMFSCLKSVGYYEANIL